MNIANLPVDILYLVLNKMREQDPGSYSFINLTCLIFHNIQSSSRTLKKEDLFPKCEKFMTRKYFNEKLSMVPFFTSISRVNYFWGAENMYSGLWFFIDDVVAVYGTPEIIKYISKNKGFELHTQTMLVQSIKYNNLENVRYLYSRIKNEKEKSFRRSYASYAIENDHFEVFKYLIEQGEYIQEASQIATRESKAEYLHFLSDYYHDNMVLMPQMNTPARHSYTSGDHVQRLGALYLTSDE